MNVYKNSRGFTVFNTVLMILVIAVTIYPFLYMLSTAFSDPLAVYAGKVVLLPVGFSMEAFSQMARYPNFFNGYLNSVIYTVCGTALSMAMTVLFAYPLSKKHLKGRSVMSMMVIITMVFGGGMIPGFLLVKGLGLMNSMWALIVPGMINQFNLIIMITSFRNFPQELEEAAQVDGLSPIRTLLRIVLPLSKPMLAAITLFYAVDIWNDWFRALLYINTQTKLPVMFILRNIVTTATNTAHNSAGDLVSALPVQSLQSAAILLVAVPVIIIYPFVQKYFVTGVMIGSIKE